MKKSINVNATEKVVIKNAVIEGGYETVGGTRVNGKVNFSAPVLEISNVTIATGSTMWNVFEGPQTPSNEATLQKSVTAKGITCNCPTLNHNVLNIYTPADNAVITVKDSTFNLNVDNSNVVRMSNYANSENVTIKFENVNWNYSAGTSFDWAGLLIYQPAGNDIALSGDTSKVATWKVVFKNCKYNGEVITSNNFGENNQAAYLYNVGGTKAKEDASTVFNITFE